MHDPHGPSNPSLTQSLEETIFTSSQSLHFSVVQNDISRTRRLLHVHPNCINELDSAGYTALLYAQSSDMILLLANAGANVYAMTPAGHRTLLHRLVLNNNLAGVLTCITNCKVKDEIKDAEGKYALDLARERGFEHIEVVIRGNAS